MKTVKKLFLIIVLIILVWQTPRWIVLIGASWDYIQTKTICTGLMPLPPTGEYDKVLATILEVSDFFVITDQGKLFIGDEYLVPQEFHTGGGSVVLLWIDNKGATFSVLYKIRDPDTNKYISSSKCRWFLPKGVYR
jgi:hypothetical protein